MEHQQKNVKVNNVDLNLTFLVKFSICVVLLIYLMEKSQSCLAILWKNNVQVVLEGDLIKKLLQI